MVETVGFSTCRCLRAVPRFYTAKVRRSALQPFNRANVVSAFPDCGVGVPRQCAWWLWLSRDTRGLLALRSDGARTLKRRPPLRRHTAPSCQPNAHAPKDRIDTAEAVS